MHVHAASRRRKTFFALSFMLVIDFYACLCGKSPPEGCFALSFMSVIDFYACFTASRRRKTFFALSFMPVIDFFGCLPK